ncbi:MATE family efflux transporter [Methanosphaera sp. ISO3-F5]|uniref:MATE family efflux transporter n=1 Tax=Methanosphaera sp. ISO3-F5 TaxID=1452353 RepID=UPI002B25788A|nr:MATE family efflux transporter [Methanosphaera sp. ISO3-F5]WQH65050.1 MATE family efflux transporter [Methanosphaera sp. ISO3-F5]
MKEKFSKREETEGVNLLRGNPKEAVLKLSIPLMLSMMIISLYNIIDSFWIAGLGADELAAVGFVIPLEFLIISIGTSMGAGITSVVSKYIGQKDDKMADNSATHSVILSLIVSIIVTVIFTVFMKELLICMGARGMALNYAMQYARIYFVGSIFVVMPNALYGLLRSEGDNKRTMYVMVFCAVINMILDPIFIYSLDMGMFGAALSTVLSLIMVLFVIIYWIYIKKDTYLKPTLSHFNYKPEIFRDILKVAIPSICEMIFITFITAMMHFIILAVSTTDSVAVFENGWRMVTLATEPMMAISVALISIIATNYGAQKYENMRIAYNYSMKIGTILGVLSLVVFLVFAPQIAYIFSYGETSIRLFEPTVEFFHIFAWFFIVFPGGVISTYMFQGLGKGTTSLIFTIIREAICATLFAVLFGVILKWGINGVWFGILVGYTIGGLIAIISANNYLNKLVKENKTENTS